jgi:diadenosine tetraphosphate (Ap4A) HIT family hydrolase
MSPTVFKENGYRFFFFSREESRMHIHIVSGDGEAKFWLEPQIELAKNYQYTRKQLKEIESLLEEHYNELISAWQQYFSC